MVKIEVSKVAKVPLSRVIEYFANPEAYFSTHSKYYKEFKIVSRQQNVILVDEKWEFEGHQLNLVHQVILNLPKSIDLEIIEGDGKGSKETIAFEPTSEGTEITYASDFRLGGLSGKVIGWLASKQIKKMLKEMAEEDCKCLENSPSPNGNARD